jgi:hypothetical protein
VILSGGNIDASVYRRIASLISVFGGTADVTISGRHVRF